MINLSGLIWFSTECRIWLSSNVQLDAKIWEMEAENGVKFNDGYIILKGIERGMIKSDQIMVGWLSWYENRSARFPEIFGIYH